MFSLGLLDVAFMFKGVLKIGPFVLSRSAPPKCSWVGRWCQAPPDAPGNRARRGRGRLPGEGSGWLIVSELNK